MLRALVDGVAEADSWATDAHKWLNVPYDSGVAIGRDAAAHAAAMNSFAGAEYIPEPQHDERYQADWVPEFSRRACGFAVYAALRELGRRGVAELVERCCGCARLMAAELARDPRATVLNDVTLNQVVVRFARDGANVTDDVIDAVQREGTCWMSAMGGGAGDADIRLQLAHLGGRHATFRHGDPQAGGRDHRAAPETRGRAGGGSAGVGAGLTHW